MALVASTAFGTDGSVGTSTAIDTTGAQSILIAVGNRGVATFTLTDNKGNTYTALTDYNNGWGSAQIFHCLAPVVGTGHTVTLTSSLSYAAAVVYAFSEILAHQVTNGGTGTFANPVATGSVTPATNGALIITCSGGAAVTSVVDTVTPGFGTVTTVPMSVNNTQTSAAWQIQATAAPITPAWTSSPQQSEVAVTVAVFEISAAPPPSRVNITATTIWSSASGTTFAASALSVTAGNLIAVGVWGNASGGESVTGITDTAGNTYTKINHAFHASDFYRGEIWYARNIAGHAANVVTATWSGAVGYRSICVAQYRGLATSLPVVDATAIGTGSGSATTASFTTTGTNSLHLLIGRLGYSMTPPAGFTNGSPEAPPTGAVWFEKTAGPLTGTYTLTHGGNVFVVFAALLAAPPPPAATGTAQAYVWGPL